ncbi:Asp-tRNA(Asn)/Glu-tRNA(Gln) amidotransferase subunit GatA [Thermoleophilia bacterium SCSIO 60948]|nr:Asp-tRNA(Asn)/Glu-tRNA(Gln) amidotransferase subunit GatA [Thermoleophilia bacterium SCSIO 60948]
MSAGGDEHVLELSAAEALEAIRGGELDAREIFELYAGRAASDATNSYLWTASPDAELGPTDAALGGLPLAVKDLFCTEGIETTSGSRILEGYVPPYTATSVARVEAAGASILGKTNMDEFAMGSSNENSAYGPVLNPWDHSRVPGGSSGGSAATVAARTAPWALGTDTGGSIRQPASLCGIVGLKPTYGAISRYGMIAFASSLDQCGTLTRTVADSALLLRELEGRDPMDSTSFGIPEPIELPTRQDLSGLRFGVGKGFGSDAEGIEPGVAEVFDAAIGEIFALGGEVTEVELPHAHHGISAYYVLAPAEASSNLARYDGVRYGFRAPDATDLGSMYELTREQGFGAEVKRRIMLGTYALSSGYYDAYYGRAQKVRTLIAADLRRVFSEVDFLITPTSPTVAFELGERTADPLAMYLSDYFTVPMSLAGTPAISIPAGLAEPAGGGPELPVGLQIAGPAFSESKLLDAAHALEAQIEFDPSPAVAR